jgi:hypothetical protein
MEEDEPSAPPSSRPSQVPSWVTLGFALGALFVMALPRPKEKAAPTPPEPEPVQRPLTPPQLTTIEAVFAQWEQYAVWSGDVTEVALWNAESRSFSDYYEVLRIGEHRYFRSISRLTRPLLTHGVVTESPLQFTESAAERAKWLGDVRQENWRAFSQGLHDSLSSPPAKVEPEEQAAPVAKPDNPK